MKKLYVLMCAMVAILAVSALGQVDYWREDHNTSNVWMSVDLAPGESKTFTVSNVSGIPQNPDNVFVFFDDFNDNSLDPAKWSTVESLSGGACSFGEVNNEELDLQAIVNANCRVFADANFSLGYAIESRVFIDSNPSGAPDETFFGWTDATEFGATAGTGQALFDRTESTFEFRLHDGTKNNNTAVTIVNGAYALKTVVRLTNETYWVEDRDPTDRGPNTFDDSYGLFQNDMKVSFFAADASGSPSTPPIVKSDWLFVRPAVYNEPTVDITGASELTVTITNNEATSLTNYNVLLENVMGGDLSIEEQVPPPEPTGNVCEGNDALSMCTILAGTGIGLNTLFTFVSDNAVVLLVSLSVIFVVLVLVNDIGDGLGKTFKNLFRKR